MSDKFILDANGKPEPCDDLLAWGRWMQTADRHVAKDKIGDDVVVSTVFLGLDHRLGGPGAQPVLYETMIFGGPHDGYTERYETRAQALRGHVAALALARSAE